MAGMRFKKIKLTNDDKIHITYEKPNKKGGWDDFSFNCVDEALPEFYGALGALAEDVVEMCELSPENESRITVRGVSISFAGEAEVMGATISASKALIHSNSPLQLNTPHKIEEPYNEGPGDDNALLSGQCARRLYLLFEQARRYVDGDRAQADLFKTPQPQPEEQEQPA